MKSLCQKCYSYPKLRINPDNLKEVKVKCRCYQTTIISIKEYISYVESNPSNTKLKCEIHNKSYSLFCLNCNAHICDDCKEYYEKIFIQNKNSTNPIEINKTYLLHMDCKAVYSINLNKIRKSIEQAKQHLSNYFSKLYDNIVLKTKKNDEMNLIYEESKSINTDILNLLEIILDNDCKENKNEYQENINNNCMINIYNCEDESNIESVMEYFENYVIIKIINRIIKEVKCIPSGSIDQFALLKDGKIVICAMSWIKIYDPNNDYNCVMSVEEQKIASFSSVCILDDDSIVGANYDKDIAIYEIENKTINLKVFLANAHNAIIDKVCSLPNNRFASCSLDNKVIIWEKINTHLYQKSTIFKLEDSSESLYLLNDKKTFFICSFDLAIMVDIDSFKPIKIIKNSFWDNKNGIYQIDEDRIICSKLGGIQIRNFKSGIVENEIVNKSLGFIGAFTIMEKGFIISVFGEKLSRIGLYDPETNLLTTTERSVHDKYINDCLKVNDDIFITGSLDKQLKVWKYSKNNSHEQKKKQYQKIHEKQKNKKCMIF